MARRKIPKNEGVFRNAEYINLLDKARKTLEGYIAAAGPDDANSQAAKRAVRALMSQDDLQFLKVLEKNADNLDPVSLAKRIVSAENSIRKKYSPSPGVEMHHVNSISSWYEKIKNMPTKEAMQANHYVQSKGHILGTDKRLLPITKDIHQGGRDIPTAHSDIIKSVQADRWVVDQGAWKTDRPAAFDADPFEVGDEFIDEAANIQGRLSFHAYEDPTEVKARKALRIKTGHQSYSKTVNNPQLRAAQKAEQKAMGINLGDIRRQLMPDRKALRAMAAAGIAAPSLLGTAASAAETTGRVQLARETGNPVDWIQAGLAGASSAGDLAGYTGALAIPGEVVSTAADLANVAIDTARMPTPRPIAVPQAQSRPRTATAARTQGQVMPAAALASKNRMQADLSGNLSPQQIESFRAGGGNAAMMRDGLSVQQVIERGSSLRLKKIVNSTIRDQV